MEAFWFFCFHERNIEDVAYGPAVLKTLDRGTVKAFAERLRPGDIGDYFDGSYPSMEAIEEARAWLVGFSKRDK